MPGPTDPAFPPAVTARTAARPAHAALGARLRLLKWLGIVVPLLFLGGAEYLRGRLFPGEFYSLGSRIFFFGVLAVAVALFSHGVFSLVDRLESEIVRQNEQLTALNRVAGALSESAGLESLLQVSLDQVLSVLRAEAGLICTVDLAQGEHSAVASRGFSEELVRSIHRARLCDDPVACQVVETGQPVAIERLFDHPGVSEVAAREGVRSSISVPLKSHGEIAGIMAVASRAERQFGEADRELLASVAGQLGMAIKHATVFERSLQRNREMEALVTISSAAVSSLDLRQMLDRTLETILGVTSADAAAVWLADEEGLTLACRHGAVDDPLDAAPAAPSGEGIARRAFETAEPVARHDAAATDGDEPDRPGGGFRTHCAFPLMRLDAPLGVLVIGADAVDALTSREELRLLAGVTEVLSVAIENARLYERVQDAAVLEERERLAREMHDGLAQVLAYVKAQALAIGKLVSADRLEEAHEELAKLEAAVSEVYADVREAIVGLRTAPRSSDGLVASLREYLRSYEQLTGTRAELRTCDRAESARLPSGAEIQLMRIVQEALANVRKHAHAHTATVSVELDSDWLRVAIEDDGRGFDPDRLVRHGWPRFGLQTMRERADAIGGELAVVSSPGSGTKVLIALAAHDAPTTVAA